MAFIRGAVCAENTKENISQSAVGLVEEILRRNGLRGADVQAILFTCTGDLNACYPAAAVRAVLGDKIAYFCTQEMYVVGSLDHCIRVCVVTDRVGQEDCKHVYLGKASALRPDLS